MDKEKKESELEVPKSQEEKSSRKLTEDEIAEKIFKYSQGCSLIMMVMITILVFLIWLYFS